MRLYLISALALLAPFVEAQNYTQTNLVSNLSEGTPMSDPNLVNAWGICRGTGTPWWISDNGSDLTTLYDGTGAPQTLVVSIAQGSPTGCVYNGTGGFVLPNGKPALFLFASESGTISGWAPGASETTVMVATPTASYKGLTIASFGGAYYLYATDFHNGRVDVFDSQFRSLRTTMTGITDNWFTSFPGGPGFAPYNIRNVGGNLILAIAQQDGARHDSVSGAGLGYVASFTPQGQLIRVFEHNAWLNAPWGIAQAPGDFGAFSHNLLVGNFGSGQIVAYDLETGSSKGVMMDGNGNPIVIDELWDLSFGAGDAKSGSATSLYFSAGPDDESNGLFGTLTAATGDQGLGSGH